MATTVLGQAFVDAGVTPNTTDNAVAQARRNEEANAANTNDARNNNNNRHRRSGETTSTTTANLALKTGGAHGFGGKDEASVLYDGAVAAAMDVLAVHEIATNGLEELIRMDSAFARFARDDSIFSAASVRLDREMLTASEDAELKAKLEAFLRLLGGFYLESAAKKAMEYLVRKYRVYIHEQDVLLTSLLPYHETHDFARVLALCRGKFDAGATYRFLDVAAANGARVPRKVIATRCADDSSLLDAIGCAAQTGAGADARAMKERKKGASTDAGDVAAAAAVPNRPAIALFISVALEVLSRGHVCEATVNSLLPFIVASMDMDSHASTTKTNAARDFTAGMLMVVVELTGRAELSPSSAAVIFGAVMSVTDAALVLAVMKVTLRLLQTQMIPDASSMILKLTRLPGAVDALRALENEIGRGVRPLLDTILVAAAEKMGSISAPQDVSNAAADFVAAAIVSVNCACIVRSFSRTLLEQVQRLSGDSEGGEDHNRDKDSEESGATEDADGRRDAARQERVDKVINCLRLLEGFFPKELEFVLKAVLSGGGVNDVTLAAFQRAFAGTLRYPVAKDLTLVTALDASSASVRVSALKKVDIVLVSPVGARSPIVCRDAEGESNAVQGTVSSSHQDMDSYAPSSFDMALLRRVVYQRLMNDDSDAVVIAALELKSFAKILGHADSISALKSILAPFSGRSSAVVGVATRVLREQFLGADVHAEMRDAKSLEAAGVLLECMIVTHPRMRSHVMTVLRHIEGATHPALLSSLVRSSASLAKMVEKGDWGQGSYSRELFRVLETSGANDFSKRDRKDAALASVNADIVDAFCEGVAGEDGHALDARIVKALYAAMGVRGRCLVLLSLYKLFSVSGYTMKVTLAQLVIDIVVSLEWDAVSFVGSDESVEDEVTSMLETADDDAANPLMWSKGRPAISWYREFQQSPQLCHAGLLRRVFLTALPFLRRGAIDKDVGGAEKRSEDNRNADIGSVSFADLFLRTLELEPEALFVLHLETMLSRIPASVSRARFLSWYIEGIEVVDDKFESKMPRRCLRLLEGWWMNNPGVAVSEISDALVSLLLAMTNASKGVRSSACRCVDAVLKGWKRVKNDTSGLQGSLSVDASDLQNTMDVLEDIAADTPSILTDREFIVSFITRRDVSSSDDDKQRRVSEKMIDALIAYLSLRGQRSPSTVVTMAAAVTTSSSTSSDKIVDRTYMVSRIVDVCDDILDRILRKASPSVSTNGILSFQEIALANEIILLYLRILVTLPTAACSFRCLRRFFQLLNISNVVASHVTKSLTMCTLNAIDKTVVKALMRSLNADDRVLMLRILLRTSTSSTEPGCQVKAASCLSMPFPASAYAAVLLNPVMVYTDDIDGHPRAGNDVSDANATQSRHSRSRKRRAVETSAGKSAADNRDDDDSSSSARMDEDKLRCLRDTLETMHSLVNEWEDANEIVSPLCSVIARLLGPVAVANGGRDQENDARTVEDTVFVCGYVLQLALSTLETVAQRFTCDEVPVELIVRCVVEGTNSGARSTALRLLGIMAEKVPKRALRHILGVLSHIKDMPPSALRGESLDYQSISQAMAMITPAWVAQGKSVDILLKSIVDALPAIPAHRRVPLLLVVLRKLGEEEMLEAHTTLLRILVTSVHDIHRSIRREAIDSSLSTSPKEAFNWYQEVAEALCANFQVHKSLAAFHALVSSASGESDDNVALKIALVSFSSSQLKSARVEASVTKILARGGPEGAENGADSLVRSIRGIAFLCLDEISATCKQKELLFNGTDSPNSSVMKKAKQLSVLTQKFQFLLDTAGSLLDALSYLKLLTDAINYHEDVRVGRRVLVLLSQFVERGMLPPGGAPASRPKRETSRQRPERKRRVLSLEEAETVTTHYCDAMSVLLQDACNQKGSKILVSALQSLQVMAQNFIRVSTTPFYGILLLVLPLLRDRRADVSSAAFTCMEIAISLLGSEIVPRYPDIVSPSIMAARSVVDYEETKAAAVLPSALAFVSTALETLGSLVVVDLPTIIEIVMKPISDDILTLDVRDEATALPIAVVKSIPPRLLLPLVLGAYDQSMGKSKISRILYMVKAMGDVWKRQDLSDHHTMLLDFLSRALDFRAFSKTSTTSHQDVEDVESAALKTTLSIVMKLKESSFKNFFMSLYKRAQCREDEDDDEEEEDAGEENRAAGTLHLPRQFTLLRSLNVFISRLRSIFIPYMIQSCGVILNQLSVAEDKSGAIDTDRVPKAKRRRGGQKKVASDDIAQHDLADRSLAWRCRIEAIHCLTNALSHDNGSFIGAKFDSCLSVLLTQLTYEPDSEVVDAALEASADADEESVRNVSLADFETALSACIVNLASAAGGGDASWKPLNYGILMATRDESARVRRLAVSVLASLIERLQQEFLVLLPETLPFLAELLEDADEDVARQCEALIRTLESLSGEDLGQYLT